MSKEDFQRFMHARDDRRFQAALAMYRELTRLHGLEPCDEGKTWQEHARENAAFAWEHADIFLAADPALDAPAPGKEG